LPEKISKGGVLDEEVFNHGKVVVPKDSNGIITIKTDDRAIRLIRATSKTVDVLNLTLGIHYPQRSC